MLVMVKKAIKSFVSMIQTSERAIGLLGFGVSLISNFNVDADLRAIKP